MESVSDANGLTVSTWVCGDTAANVWERIFDFGKGETGPYVFLTRFMRGDCFNSQDIAADAGKAIPNGEWTHVAMTVTGTQGGTQSSAGPRIYVNGELVADGFISQTSSGTYKQLREWLATLDQPENYQNCYIGHSQFGADPDFCGAISDFRIYQGALSEEEIIEMMCESLSAEEILELARNKFLPAPEKIVTKDLDLKTSLMDGRVEVKWECSRPTVIQADGKICPQKDAQGVTLTAVLSSQGKTRTKSFTVSVLPEDLPPYELTVHGDREVLKISDTLYGLFYEDINNAADGGIYAEMINNRSFENFTFDTYDARSGENGTSTGRNHEPLKFWFGDLDKVKVQNEGGLNAHFGIEDPDTAAYYIEVEPGTVLQNRGFCDNCLECSMNLKENESYHFTIWAKAEKAGKIRLQFLDDQKAPVSKEIELAVEGNGTWKKYAAEVLVSEKTLLGQLQMTFEEKMAVDMISLMPDQVWGAEEEKTSESAHKNFLGNSNYRFRRDLVETLVELHPTFLRFPGGCISEGSYIWDNVYDWKDSVGDVAIRKENFNVWGYMMTLGLGYMEYFQLAEDLNAEPLPVMACGVLCQARSDYANPAGGRLQEKYINNFTDLIDFAISTDFENNCWAALRKEMGHEAPFGLHYLGVGNENWGTEFFASFETFKAAIDAHMKKNYPGYFLQIISTAGAQADDDAYQQGWKFLTGNLKGGAVVAFTDGEKSFEQEVEWYQTNKDYLDTIVDEHYYRANDYLLENVDRYNYYYRGEEISKVFVGEYASSEKNTLAGAVAEAAVMTGFEQNSDVVRLAATAPLFNKVVKDGTYRWTPDAIWFDNETVWRTPNYYVQQLFAKYIGKSLLETTYATYENGQKKEMAPTGGILVQVEAKKVDLKQLKVVKNHTNEVLFEQDFTQEISPRLSKLPETAGLMGYYLCEEEWSDYTVTLVADKKEDDAIISVGAGLRGVNAGDWNTENLDLMKYCVGMGANGTGLKVIKEGKEGYTMGDYSSSVFAGNLRACYDQKVEAGTYTVTVNYGGEDQKQIRCFYQKAGESLQGVLECKLERYNRDIHQAVTMDEEHVYVKLVNADEYAKQIALRLEELDLKEEGEWITLTGDLELAHMSNVNTREKEEIVPKQEKICLKDHQITVKLPAQSVNVLVFERK